MTLASPASKGLLDGLAQDSGVALAVEPSDPFDDESVAGDDEDLRARRVLELLILLDLIRKLFVAPDELEVDRVPANYLLNPRRLPSGLNGWIPGIPITSTPRAPSSHTHKVNAPPRPKARTYTRG